MAIPRAASRPRSRENRTRYVVLGMLTLGPMNGYCLRQAIAGSVGHFWQESFGQLYPALRALAAEGLVRTVRGTAHGGRHGATYEVTPRGRRVLAAWLAKPPVIEPARNEVLLKVFFAGAVPPEITARNLAAVVEQLRGKLAELEAIASGWAEKVKGHPDAPFWRLTLDFGLVHIRTALRWLDDAQRVIRSEARPATARPKAVRSDRGGGNR